MKSTIRYLARLPSFGLICSGALLAVLSQLLFLTILLEIRGSLETAPVLLPTYGPIAKSIASVLIGPLIETVFQWLIISCLHTVLKLSYLISGLLFILLFTVIHSASPLMSIPIALGGVIFTLIYYVRDRPEGHPFACSFATHAIANAIVFSIKFL